MDKAKTERSGDDIEIQRQLAKYTKNLVWVGIGQAVVLALTLIVIWRQAKLMKIHADHLKSLASAAESNTLAAGGQLKAMQDQLGQMQDSGKQTDKLIEHAAAQVTELNLSAAAARASADAALQNAQALINAGRPWVTVKVTREVSRVKGLPYFEFQIFNYGKSAARILSCVGPIEADYRFPESELPVPPDYGENALWTERFLAPGDNFQIGIISLSHTATESERKARCASQGINVKDAKFVVYGRIEYSDGVSPRTHETRYCYNHVDEKQTPWGANDPVGGKMILCGPREYNLYT